MKLLKFVFVSFFLNIATSLYCQTYSKISSDTIIIDFIKKTIGFKELNCQIFSWDSCDLFQNDRECILKSYIVKEKDSIISQQLILEFQNQFGAIKKDCPKTFSFLKNIAHKKKFSYVSIPLISANEDVAVIKYGSWCGDECGSGGIYLYKKIKNKWKLVEIRCTWIS